MTIPVGQQHPTNANTWNLTVSEFNWLKRHALLDTEINANGKPQHKFGSHWISLVDKHPAACECGVKLTGGIHSNWCAAKD